MIMQEGTGHYLNHLDINFMPITLKHVNTNYFFMLIFFCNDEHENRKVRNSTSNLKENIDYT